MSLCTYIIRKKDSKEIYHHCSRGKVLLFYLFGDYYVCLYMIYGHGFEWTISCYYCILKTDTSNILMHKQKSTWAIVKTWWVHSHQFPRWTEVLLTVKHMQTDGKIFIRIHKSATMGAWVGWWHGKVLFFRVGCGVARCPKIWDLKHHRGRPRLFLVGHVFLFQVLRHFYGWQWIHDLILYTFWSDMSSCPNTIKQFQWKVFMLWIMTRSNNPCIF